MPVDTTHWEETQPVSPAPEDIPVPVQAPALCCVPLGTMPTMQAPPAHPVQRGTIVPLTACLNLWRVPQATIKPAVGKPAVPSVGKVGLTGAYFTPILVLPCLPSLLFDELWMLQRAS